MERILGSVYKCMMRNARIDTLEQTIDTLEQTIVSQKKRSAFDHCVETAYPWLPDGIDVITLPT